VHLYREKQDKKPDYWATTALPAVFNIDFSVCMSCQICVEVCPFDAIKMDTEFELSTDNRSTACSSARTSWQVERLLSQDSSDEAAKWTRASRMPGQG